MQLIDLSFNYVIVVRLLYYNCTFKALRYWNFPTYLRCRF